MDNDRNVGIGTSSPAGKLHVAGAPGNSSVILPADAISSAEILNETIRAVDIAANAVGASEIAPNAVGASEIAPNAVGASEIAPNAVGASEIVANSVTSADLANDRLSLSKVSAGVAHSFSGRIGIGTTNPGTAKLAVIGGNLGIGNTAPASPLSFVTGDGRKISYFENSQFGRFGVDLTQGLLRQWAGKGGWHQFGNDGGNGKFVNRVTIDPTGLLVATGGHSGFKERFSNVTLNVRGHSDSIVFNTADSLGKNVLQVQADHDVFVTGDFFVSGDKNFILDHPLDPANKSLVHNAVEGPGRYTFYHGRVALDDQGEAWVELPEYFEALNTDVVYQLTCVGGFANVYVAEEVSDNQFKIAGGHDGLTVCWQISATRNDPWSADHPYQPVIEKDENDRGRYYYPAGYGMPEELNIALNLQQQADPSEAGN